MSLEIHSKLRRCGPLLLAGVLMVNSLPIGALAANIRDFKDVDGHWAYNALDWAVENGVMTGTSEDTMSPDGFLTRAQMATMIDRLYGHLCIHGCGDGQLVLRLHCASSSDGHPGWL